jgi:predicted  nucleic acid-binding Zn-ribbon protein
MHPDLQRLIELQRLDSAAHLAERRIAGEAERQRALDAQLEAAREQVAAATKRLAENQNARRTIEKDVAVHQGRLSKFRDQLMAVKTNIEYQAMQKEIEYAQTEVKKLEDQVLERMVEADDLASAVKRTEAALAAEQKTVDADRKALVADVAEQKTALERLTSERVAVVSSLDPKVLTLFDLVSRRRNGVAVAEAKDGICTICHVRLRPQVFNTVLRNDEILQCDHCNRILFFTPVAKASADAVSQPAS